MDDIFNLIKTILPQILPVASLLLGMWIQSSMDNRRDNKNYLRKYKENEIIELKNYFKVFSKNFKNILDDCSLFDTVINDPTLHNAFKKSLRNFNETDLEYIMLMQNIYFSENDFDDFVKSSFILTQFWLENSQIKNMDDYKNTCSEMIKKGRKYQKDIIQLIKQDELLSLK
jgi:hypothetical protein